MTFDDPVAGHGTIGYGGLEWARAGIGMWHGKELSAGSSPWCRASSCGSPFRLNWSAPNQKPSTSAPSVVPSIGPARLIVGTYETATSPVRAPRGINYLLVTLKPGERWSYEPPAGHTVGWVAVGKGALSGSERLSNGELAIFEPGEAPITFEGAEGTGATFVLGSAVPHPYELHLGAYSVHTSADALAAGERNLRELKKRLDARGDRRTASGSTPVFRG